ncbi:hypothetical protein V6N13_013697 [Hibiscus sabdariffa]
MATEKQVMVIAMDDSPHSMYALEWTLDHLFAPFGSVQPFHLVVVHARPVPISVLQLAGPGDPRNVLCEAVEKHNASVLVVGSHGYGPMKRAVLGSVSDYCAHHAHCSVMIVKKPKT